MRKAVLEMVLDGLNDLESGNSEQEFMLTKSDVNYIKSHLVNYNTVTDNLNGIYRVKVSIKGKNKMPIFIQEMRELENNLKNLKIGFVVDVPALEEEKAICLRNFYNNGKYEIKGPNLDNNNPGKYVLAFLLNPKRELKDVI